MPKRRLEDLVVFGGEPAFAEPLHVGRPQLGERDAFVRRVDDLWERRHLTNGGPYEQEFEKRLQEFLDVPHCVVTCNATLALAILLRALGLRGEVLLPSFTFVATAHAVEWQGLTPVFCDVDAGTHNLDPDDVERRITPASSAILGVHLWGRPAPIEELASLAARHDLRLLFDAAHAFGSAHRGRPIGGFGDAEVFSFHATKVLNSFEGGAITTSDPALAGRLRSMRNFGFTGYDRVESPGINAKMSEVGAAMGLTSLESIERFMEWNRRHYDTYRERLADVRGVSIVPYDEAEHSNYQYVVSEIDAAVTGLTRDELKAVLWSENILARRYFYPGCHRMAPYAEGATDRARLPVTDRLAARVLCLPSGSGLGSGDIALIADTIALAVAHGAAVRDRLQSRDAGPGDQEAGRR